MIPIQYLQHCSLPPSIQPTSFHVGRRNGRARIGIFRSHQPAAFIETPARMLGFFNDSESENFLHLGGSRAYEIVIIEQIKRKSINMEKRVFMN
ncbi:hypothetical protein NDQ65_05750 [Neisseria gonorrhoeae]|nr:hypothetical protein NDQ65_05750 [Neisseria gonorrhoeae]